jgi:hypothetical protein
MHSDETKPRAHTLSENLEATSKFQAPEGWHEKFCTEEPNSGVTCERLVFMLNNKHVYVWKTLQSVTPKT